MFVRGGMHTRSSGGDFVTTDRSTELRVVKLALGTVPAGTVHTTLYSIQPIFHSQKLRLSESKGLPHDWILGWGAWICTWSFLFSFFFFLVILVFELRGSCLIPGDAKKEGKEGKKEERKEGRKEGREKKCLFFIYSS
jgi:hypothetical protein